MLVLVAPDLLQSRDGRGRQAGRIFAEQGRERAQQALGLPPRTTKGQAQQVPGLDRYVRVAARTPSLARAGRVPGRKRLRGDPDREAAPLLQRSVILWPKD